MVRVGIGEPVDLRQPARPERAPGEPVGFVHRAPVTYAGAGHVDCVREPVDSPDAVALLRDYFAELTVRYFHRETTEQEIDETLDEFPSTGLALFLVLRAGGVPAGCLGLHPTGELTRIYVAPQFRRAGGARALLSAAESWPRSPRRPPASSSTPAPTSSRPAPSMPPLVSSKSPQPPQPQAPSRITGSRSPSLSGRPSGAKRWIARPTGVDAKKPQREEVEEGSITSGPAPEQLRAGRPLA